MEKKGSARAASDTLWLDKNSRDHNQAHLSQWLQSTLAEFERKTKMILELVEDKGDTFTQRAEMYYKKRPEIIKVIVDLQRSYVSLANKYDLLRTESLCDGGGSSSNPLRLPSSAGLVHLQEEEEDETQAQDKGINPKISNDEHQLQGPHVSTHNSSSDSEMPESWTLSNLVRRLMMSKDPRNEKLRRDKGDVGGKVCNVNGNTTENEMNKLVTVSAGGGGFDDDPRRDCSSNISIIRSSSERENTWNKMRLSVSELIEDNLSQQAELIKRNNEKRKYIKELGLYVNQLQNENKCLKELIAQQQRNATSSNKTIDQQHVKQNRSDHSSKLKCWFFRKKL